MKKHSLPFSDNVAKYFSKYPNKYLDIYVGKNAQRESEWDAMYPNDIKPSLYLPHMHDFKVYWWPVKNLEIVLWWNSDSDRQIEFANYLVNICGATCVFSIVNDELVKFAITSFDRRIAA